MATNKSNLDETDKVDTKTEDMVERMIKFLNDHTEYKVVTNDEYNSFFQKHSSPKQEVKLENDNPPPPPRPPPPDLEFSRIPPPTPKRKDKGKGILNVGASHIQSMSGFSQSNIANWQRPRIPVFSGDQKGETTFEVWKFEVKCIVREGNYTETVILQAVRNSLKGQARSLLLTLPENATPNQIVEKLEGVFGNVYSSEALLQKFYMEKQQPNQTVADYGMKLESILQSAIEKGHISSDSKDEMLRSKFWSGLSDPLLRNASRHKYDTIKNFDELRREIRAIELDLSNSATASIPSQVQQSSISVESQKLTEVLKKLDTFNKRIDSMETELKGLKVQKDSSNSTKPDTRYNRGSYGRGFHRGQGHFQSRGRGNYNNHRVRGSYNYNERGRGYNKGNQSADKEEDLNS